LLNDTIDSPAEPMVSRRGFLRSFANAGLRHGMKHTGISSEEQTPFVAPGQLLPATSSKTIWPYMPCIDIARCNGCDACARLCPQQAIILHETEGYSCYVLDAKNCTGCRICIDVCDQDAVSLQRWQAQEQREVTLKCGRCSACGALFHAPTDQQLSGRVLCRICSNNNHHQNLFQILT
jgi:ferredoxin